MKINIIAVGKLKEKYFEQAAGEYVKRLSRFCNLNITEIPDEKIAENASTLMCAKVLEKEGGEILKRIRGGRVVALCIEGKKFSSKEVAKMLENEKLCGGEITFIIGGSLGLSPEVRARADLLLSMSEMTFPHMLARVMLLEQIYRAFKINANEIYHK